MPQIAAWAVGACCVSGILDRNHLPMRQWSGYAILCGEIFGG